MLQAKTEIELLEHLREKDPEDENNIIRLQDHFIHRGHQCLVFEMLSWVVVVVVVVAVVVVVVVVVFVVEEVVEK